MAGSDSASPPPLSPLEIFIWMKRAGKGGRDTRKGKQKRFCWSAAAEAGGGGIRQSDVFKNTIYLPSNVLSKFAHLLKTYMLAKKCKCRMERQQQTTMNGTRGRRQGGGGGGGGGKALRNSVYVFICVREE